MNIPNDVLKKIDRMRIQGDAIVPRSTVILGILNAHLEESGL
jgi:hypothetical protein